MSLCLMALGALVNSIASPLYEESQPAAITLSAVSYFLCLVGVAGFEANVVQFGLDQLMDHNSRYLSLYLHWLVWFKTLGGTIAITPLALANCDVLSISSNFELKSTFQLMPLPYFLFLIFSVIIVIRMRKTFYTELGSIVPYKTVIKIIRYAIRHRHPQRRRSAFFYYSGLQPGRLDLAKSHYGGLFSTEDVENVKTFLQLLCLILSMGPIYILSVSTSYFMHQHYVEHLVNISLITNHCLKFWPLLGSGNSSNMISLLFFPVYTVIIFKIFKKIPRILIRLLIGLIILTACVLSILLTEILSYHQFATNERNSNETLECAFIANNGISSLNAHWTVLIAPNLFHGFATPIILATIFEFISAQSPKSMIGLIIGTLYSIKGIFQLIGVIISVPFTLESVWGHEPKFADNVTEIWLRESGHYSSCELWYLVVTSVVGILATIFFSVGAWRYKYRKREEDPFSQADIEDIVTRNIEREPRDLQEVASVEVNNSKRQLLYDHTAHNFNYRSTSHDMHM